MTVTKPTNVNPYTGNAINPYEELTKHPNWGGTWISDNTLPFRDQVGPPGTSLGDQVRMLESRLVTAEAHIRELAARERQLSKTVEFLRAFAEYVREHPKATEKDYRDYLAARKRLLDAAGVEEPEQMDLFK